LIAASCLTPDFLQLAYCSILATLSRYTRKLLAKPRMNQRRCRLLFTIRLSFAATQIDCQPLISGGSIVVWKRAVCICTGSLRGEIYPIHRERGRRFPEKFALSNRSAMGAKAGPGPAQRRSSTVAKSGRSVRSVARSRNRKAKSRSLWKTSDRLL